MTIQEIVNLIQSMDFPIMLYLAEFILCLHFPKRKRWWLSIPFLVIPFLICYFVKNVNTPMDCLKYFSAFLSTFVSLVLFLKADFWTYVYVGTLAYCFQHLTQRSSLLIRFIFFQNIETGLWTGIILEAVMTLLIYASIYFVFVYKTEKGKLPVFDNKIQLVIAAFVLVITIVLSLISIIKSVQLKDLTLCIVTIVFSIISCIAAIGLELSQTKLKEAQIDNRLLHIMLHESKAQYEASKKSIEQINIKCHDLKHLLSNIDSKITREESNQLRKQIDIYDQSFDSGNKALDVVLTEKAVECNEKGIRFTCLLNGRILNGMKDTDVYSLFENAISNAIESVMKLDEEHRVIAITQEANRFQNRILVKNYFSGDIKFNQDQVPVHQGKSIYHGYGTKSMIYLLSKYHGKTTFSTEEDIFVVSFLLPKSDQL